MKYIAYGFAILAVALLAVGIVSAVGSTSAASAGAAAMGHGMASAPNLSNIGKVLVNLGVVAAITAIVAPIKRRIERQGKAGASPASAT